MLGGDSYWGAAGSAADVVKTDKKEKKGPKAGAAAAKGVKVGAKRGKGAKLANKDPKLLKAQQAAKQLLAAKKVGPLPGRLLLRLCPPRCIVLDHRGNLA